MGLSSCGIVRVRFFTLPTWTVTYGSDVPLLSLAINPCAQITERKLKQFLNAFSKNLEKEASKKRENDTKVG